RRERLRDQSHRLADPQRFGPGDDARFDDHLTTEIHVPDEVRTEVDTLHRVRWLRREQLLGERPDGALGRQRVDLDVDAGTPRTRLLAWKRHGRAHPAS